MITISVTPAVTPLKEIFSTKKTVYANTGLIQGNSSVCVAGKKPLSLPVFANLLSSSSTRENDWFNLSIAIPVGYTISAVLIDQKTETEYTINDTTYGDYSALGVLDGNVWGFVLDFNKVADELDYGNYQVKITVASLGSRSVEFYSPCFYLRPYSCEDAHGTVRLEIEQTGYIQNGFDFNNVKDTVFAKHMIRTYGNLEQGQSVSESEVIVDNDNNSRQVQAGNYSNWNVNLKWLSGVSTDLIVKDFSLAELMIVSDYNLDSVKYYNDISLRFLNAEAPVRNRGSRFLNIVLNLEDYNKGRIKRHG